MIRSSLLLVLVAVAVAALAGPASVAETATQSAQPTRPTTSGGTAVQQIAPTAQTGTPNGTLVSVGPNAPAELGPGGELFVHSLVVADGGDDSENLVLDNVTVSLSGLGTGDVGGVALLSGPRYDDLEPVARQPGDTTVVFEDLAAAADGNPDTDLMVPDGGAVRLVVALTVDSGATADVAVTPRTTVNLKNDASGRSDERFDGNGGGSAYAATASPPAATEVDTTSPAAVGAVALVDRGNRVDPGGDGDEDTLVEVQFDEALDDGDTTRPNYTPPRASDFRVVLADGTTVVPDGVSVARPLSPQVFLDIGSRSPEDVRTVRIRPGAAFADTTGNPARSGDLPVETTNVTVSGADDRNRTARPGQQVALLAAGLDRNVTASVNGTTAYELETGDDSAVAVLSIPSDANDTTYRVAFCSCREQVATTNLSVNTTTTSTVHYQVDFAGGKPITDLGNTSSDFYGPQDRLFRYLHGSSETPVTERGEIAPERRYRECVDTQPIQVSGDTASVTFTVNGSCSAVELTLASYRKDGPGFTFSEEQALTDNSTQTFDPGTHTLTVSLPTADGKSADAGTDTATRTQRRARSG